MRAGMVIPKGTVYANQGSSSWQTASSDITVSFATNYGIKYYPAIYYVVSDTGSYSVKNASGYTISGNCASPSITHYSYFERRPGSFSSSSGIAALGPDGQCLREVEITIHRCGNAKFRELVQLLPQAAFSPSGGHGPSF